MKIILHFSFILCLFGISPVIAQQVDSPETSSIKMNEEFTPLSLLFSEMNMVSKNRNADSTAAIILVSSKEKPGFFKDYIYIIGTAAVAAIIYFLWPEDNPASQKKLTFGTPPPPR